MAEETVRCLPDSPDVNRSWRRVSTRKLSFLYTEETLLPNYLRSPTGSCHDACKYGRKHEPEEEEDKKPRRVSALKRVNRSFSGGTLSFDSTPLRKKKKKKNALTKPALNGSDDGGHFCSRVCDVKMQHNEAERSSRQKKAVVSLSDSKRKKKNSFKTVVVSRRRALEMVEHDKRVTALKLKSVAQTAAMALRRSTVRRKKKTTDGGSEAQEPRKPVVSLRATTMSSSKRCSRSLKTKKESNKLSSSVPIIKTRKMVDDKCKDLVEEKTLYVIKMDTGNHETVASDHNQRCVMDPPIDDDPKSENCLDESECAVTEANDESPQQKSVDESPQDDEEEDESPQAIENENTTSQGKGKSKSKPLSTESALNGKSMRLKFKRGKVLDAGSQDHNNSPRKLKFKRGKTVNVAADTSSKTSSCQRSLKTKGTDFSNDNKEQHKPKPLEAVLKHQEDTEKKKTDSRALLFNNVIEETANKLVETRKSKVKALVGAFESVISLQDRISSPTTT